MKNSPTVLLLATVIALPSCMSVPGEGTPNFITHGPILGRVSTDGIGVWARTMRSGSFTVRYGTSRGRLDRTSAAVETRVAHDNTGWAHIKGLQPNTRYWYEIVLANDVGRTGREGSFRTLPDSRRLRDAELNPDGLFNFSFEFACGNNQNPEHSIGPSLPAFATMLERLEDRVHFAVLNGDWLYERRREFTPSQWRQQIGLDTGTELPDLVRTAPTVVGVWQNYKHFLEQGEHLADWHRRVPSFFTFDDHEILNDVWGAGTRGLRDRRAVFRDIGVRAWYDYLGWSNPTEFPQRIHFGRATLEGLAFGFLNVTGFGARRALRLGEVSSRHRIREPHYYLAALGTDPVHQGKGIGSALIEPVLARCERERLPAYLESSKEANVPFYRKHGFEVAEALEVPGGPTVWSMIRRVS